MKESIFIEEQKYITITGVTKVVSSSPNGAIVQTNDNNINITGSDMEVKKLDLDEGEVSFSGLFTNIKFCTQKEKVSLWKRIFK